MALPFLFAAFVLGGCLKQEPRMKHDGVRWVEPVEAGIGVPEPSESPEPHCRSVYQYHPENLVCFGVQTTSGGPIVAGAEVEVGGFAKSTRYGREVERGNRLVYCGDGVTGWPSSVDGTWLVVRGRLEEDNRCTKEAPLPFVCPAFRLGGCSWEARHRPSDMSAADRNLALEVGLPEPGSDVVLSGRVEEVPGDALVLRVGDATIDLDGCVADSGSTVRVSGILQFTPAELPISARSALVVQAADRFSGRFAVLNCVVEE